MGRSAAGAAVGGVQAEVARHQLLRRSPYESASTALSEMAGNRSGISSDSAPSNASCSVEALADFGRQFTFVAGTVVSGDGKVVGLALGKTGDRIARDFSCHEGRPRETVRA